MSRKDVTSQIWNNNSHKICDSWLYSQNLKIYSDHFNCLWFISFEISGEARNKNDFLISLARYPLLGLYKSLLSLPWSHETRQCNGGENQGVQYYCIRLSNRNQCTEDVPSGHPLAEMSSCLNTFQWVCCLPVLYCTVYSLGTRHSCITAACCRLRSLGERSARLPALTSPDGRDHQENIAPISIDRPLKCHIEQRISRQWQTKPWPINLDMNISSFLMDKVSWPCPSFDQIK